MQPVHKAAATAPWRPLLLACLLLASAWPPAARALDRHGFESVRFQRLGVDQGLSQSTVRAMAQDRAGFLWLATQDGLSRYDGYEFRVFRRQLDAPGALPDSHILSLASADDGGLWIGTQNGGLALFDPLAERFRSWQANPAPGGLAANAVKSLLAHRWGGLWVASAERLQFLRAADAPFTDIAGTTPAEIGEIRALREAADGAVLVASAGGVWRIDSPDARPQRVGDAALGMIDASDVAQAFDGSLWVASTDAGVFHLDADGRLIERIGTQDGLPHASVNALLFDRSGRLWIATFLGLARWSLDTRTLETWGADTAGQPDGLSAGRVASLFEDRDGLIWVGTWTNGVNLHDPRAEAFSVARPAPGNARASPGYTVVGIERASDDAVWLALHDTSSVVKLDLGRGVVDTLSAQSSDPGRRLPEGLVRAVAQAEDGTLWVGLGRSGLARRLPGGRFERIGGPDQPQWNAPDGEIYTLRFDREGTLWVSSIGGGLAALCRECSWFERFRHDPADPQSLPGDEVNGTFQSASGSIWVATRLSGLARLDRSSGKFERYASDERNPEALMHNSVTALAEDADGVLWVGTQGGGVHRALRDRSDRILRFERFNRQNSGLAADAIGSLAFDHEQKLWLATTAGLSRLDPRTGLVENFGPNEGALSAGYFIGAGLTMPDGRMLFGGARGLSIFDPRDVQRPPAAQQVAVSEVRVFGPARGEAGASANPWVRDEDGRAALRLHTSSDDFAIDLTALTFASPEQLVYEYRLEGLDHDWTRTDARRRFAAYTNVPAGEYVFRARAARPGGTATEELRLPVHVEETLTALDRFRRIALPLAVVLALASLALLWQRYRDRQRAQARLRDSEERLKLALWGTGDELWDLDLVHFRLRRENPMPYIAATGLDLVDDVRDLEAFMHPDDRPHYRAAIRQLLRGDIEFLDVTVRASHANGSTLYLRSRGRIVARDERGRATRMAGTVSDVTELRNHQFALESANRELERRVEQRTHALTEANRNLADAMGELRKTQGELVEREKMAALGGLVAGVAHEINTPLGIGVTAASHLDAATRRFLAAMGEGRLTRSELQHYADTAQESADLILRNLHRADKLIKSFKQVAVDQTSEERRPIDLAEYVDEVLTSLRPSLRKARHEVSADIPAGIAMNTLPGAIYQILSNLVQNSLVHGFAGRDGGGQMRIRAELQGDSVLFEYRDDGVGMSEDVRRRMFDPFFTTRRGSGGSGLGMHIVYNMVTRALGGTIQCESAPGEGVTISLRLPRVTATAPA